MTVGFVGTLKPWHGTDLLLRALARTHGEPAPGHLRHRPPAGGARAARRRARHRRPGAASSAPSPPSWCREILHGLDIAIAPYPAGEHYFSPLKVYEYLAAGLPMVASAIGTIPEVLGDGELGMLVEPGDVGGPRRRPR